MKTTTKNLTLSAMFLALALVLPFLTGQIPEIGSMLLPMHIPVLLCGFLCGWPWGLAVGFIAPLLRSLLFGMPPMQSVALPMAFELAAYGAFTGLLYGWLNRALSGKTKHLVILYATLIIAMLLGRIVWGVAKYAVVSLLTTNVFTLPLFFAGAFVTAWPGILLQFIIIPPIVLALKRLRFAA
jgi:riboflavin transporter FmnP